MRYQLSTFWPSPLLREAGRGPASARVAQSVEHTLGKGEVIGSIPIASLLLGVADAGSATVCRAV